MRAFRVSLCACLSLLGLELSGGARSAPEEPARTAIFAARTGLADGWKDLGWAPRTTGPGGEASLDFAGHGGWLLMRPGLAGTFGFLTVRLRAPASFGAFLEVGLDSAGVDRFPRVLLEPAAGRKAPAGFSEFRVPMRELNPRGAHFDRVLFAAHGAVGHEAVLLDEIALLEEDPGASAAAAPSRAVTMSIDCSAPAHHISPLIYGTANGEGAWWELGTTARRWGGNPNTRYNWEQGHAWNAGSDWFFRNVNYGDQKGAAYEDWLADNRAHGVSSALTVPTIGWVAKDSTSYSFPVSVFGPQAAVAPEDRDIGNGKAPDGTLLAPLDPKRTSVPAPPEFIGRWLAAIRAKDKSRGRSVHEYILDNEPTLWDTTHRDVHPEPVTYDELLERTIRYGTAVRKADPEALIAGPAAWGWTAYFFSAADVTGRKLHLDRISHGNKPLLPWWLAKVREHEKRTGVRLLDVLDVHFYPQAAGIGIGSSGSTDPALAALRIRSTRALWDPTYADESWIGETPRLIPRLREWVAENAPGLGISIGEYNFGAEGHMSGGLALAEALGRFGEQRLSSAFYWTSPAKDTPAFWAFRAFRNFDGKGGRFLDESLRARSAGALASIFASRDPSGKHLVALLLNFDPSLAAQVELELTGCGTIKSRRVLSYSGGNGFRPLAATAHRAGRPLGQRLPPYSITVLDLTVEPAAGAGGR